jgi:hypothetical protein
VVRISAGSLFSLLYAHNYCFGTSYLNLEVCSGYGTCVGIDKCTCNSGWSGMNCEITSCFGTSSKNTSVCSGRGSCISPEVCQCQNDYYGISCDSFYCSDLRNDNKTACSKRGQCVGPNNCTCDSGYQGIDCNEWACFTTAMNHPTVCSGYGKCVQLDKCECFGSGGIGPRCQYQFMALFSVNAILVGLLCVLLTVCCVTDLNVIRTKYRTQNTKNWKKYAQVEPMELSEGLLSKK